VSDVTTTDEPTEPAAARSEEPQTPVGQTPVEEASTAEPTASPAAAAGEPVPEAPAAGEDRGFRKVREGLVVSDKMTKTVVVAVEDRVQHPLYGKTIRRTKKVKAHDEGSACGVGDRVLLMETRPLSATKRWRVVQILEKAK
jgi:small subunit ribosomal protein S17